MNPRQPPESWSTVVDWDQVLGIRAIRYQVLMPNPLCLHSAPNTQYPIPIPDPRASANSVNRQGWKMRGRLRFCACPPLGGYFC